MKSNNSNIKKTILLSATKLIATKGIQHTSLADIAKDVGISKGTLYYHFASKDDIIYEIAHLHLDIITDAVLTCVQNANTKNPKDKIIQAILEKISDIESTGRVHMYLICEAITTNESLRKRIKIYYNNWRLTLKSEIQKSFVDENIAEPLSFLLLSIVDGLVVHSLLKTEPIPYESIATFLINQWL